MRFFQKYTFIKTFNLCFFIGLCLLGAYPQNCCNISASLENPFIKYGAIPLINGALTTLLCIAIARIWKNITKSSYVFKHPKELSVTAFIAGIFCIYAGYSNTAAYIISLFILYLSYINIKRFFRHIAILLLPDKEASLTQIRQFINFYINLLISYSVINIIINMLHQSFHTTPAFNFGQGISAPLNSVYFSIMTLTSIGYAEITPQNDLGRIVVGLECLIGYFVMALMLGIVLKGIKLPQKK